VPVKKEPKPKSKPASGGNPKKRARTTNSKSIPAPAFSIPAPTDDNPTSPISNHVDYPSVPNLPTQSQPQPQPQMFIPPPSSHPPFQTNDVNENKNDDEIFHTRIEGFSDEEEEGDVIDITGGIMNAQAWGTSQQTAFSSSGGSQATNSLLDSGWGDAEQERQNRLRRSMEEQRLRESQQVTLALANRLD
jgi:hypothetical protein